VIGVHFCTCYYRQTTIDALLGAIDHVVQRVGVDHVALGPDYFPEDRYQWIVPVSRLSDVTLGLVRRGYSDDEIRKILGENLLALYRRAWSPTAPAARAP
jgi:membrane dipeptidase